MAGSRTSGNDYALKRLYHPLLKTSSEKNQFSILEVVFMSHILWYFHESTFDCAISCNEENVRVLFYKLLNSRIHNSYILGTVKIDNHWKST